MDRSNTENACMSQNAENLESNESGTPKNMKNLKFPTLYKLRSNDIVLYCR